jgi:hypothetical protein
MVEAATLATKEVPVNTILAANPAKVLSKAAN